MRMVRNAPSGSLILLRCSTTCLTQAELDSLKEEFYKLPFYDRRLYNEDRDVFLMLVSLNKDILSTVRRITVMDDIYTFTRPYEERTETICITRACRLSGTTS